MELILNPLVQLGISLLILIYSAILHEIAHGLVADRLGDPTARLLGRLTLNPKPHIDPMMTIAIPLLLIISGSPVIFGGAKPVPIDPFNLKDGRKDIALVSLAGPLTNVGLAIIAALLIHGINFIYSGQSTQPFMIFFTIQILLHIVSINLLLAIFNLLPIPPLDGSKIFAMILPNREAAAYLSLGSMGIFILFLLLAMPIGGFSLQSFIMQLEQTALSILGF
jgi:Zn-dependent protease